MGTLYGECCCPAHCIETRPGRWNQSNTGGCDLAGFKPAELLHDDIGRPGSGHEEQFSTTILTLYLRSLRHLQTEHQAA